MDALGPRKMSRRRFTDHAFFGMAVFVFTEIMLFSAFISAFLIVRNSAPPGMWPPADQPRLPFAGTALNTLALLASGALVAWAHFTERRSGLRAARVPLTLGVALGVLFLVLQGREWAMLLSQGLTLTSSQVGGFFYLIIGGHAVHVVCALALLTWCWADLLRGRLPASRFAAAQLFWYFVVVVWPALWLVVYR